MLRRNRCGWVVMAALLVVWLGTPLAAEARRSKTWDEHFDDPFTKGGRGLGNLLTGWVELPYRTIKGANRRDPISSTATGMAKGLVWGLARTGVGLYELVTFPLPLPRRYRAILPAPAYWSGPMLNQWNETYHGTFGREP